MSQFASLPSTQDIDGIEEEELEWVSEERRLFWESKIWGRLLPSNGRIRPVELTDDDYQIGRGDQCEFIIYPDEIDEKYFLAISKLHFRIYKEETNSGSHVMLEDWSSNGTFINGEKVGHLERRVVCNNDEISLATEKNRVFVFLDPKAKDDENIPAEVKKKYKLTKVLGKGACGEVRLAFSKKGCDRYAIKIIHKKKFTISGQHEIEQLEQQRQVLNEISLLKRLDHPCIINIHEVFNTPDSIYLVIELVEGGELFELVSSQGSGLEESRAKLLFYQMVLAVKYLHDSGITHRDLKPENILLSSYDKETLVKVTDFGLSKFVDGTMMMKTLCGTPNYLAPEVVRSLGKASYTNAIDCWALGVILFICLSGYPPFSMDYKDLPLADQIKTGRFSFVPRYWSKVSKNAKDMVKKLLIVDPDKRMTLEQALRHPWLSDVEMHEKVRRLMHPGGTAPPSPAEKCKEEGKRKLDDTSEIPVLKRLKPSENGSTSTASP